MTPQHKKYIYIDVLYFGYIFTMYTRTFIRHLRWCDSNNAVAVGWCLCVYIPCWRLAILRGSFDGAQDKTDWLTSRESPQVVASKCHLVANGQKTTKLRCFVFFIVVAHLRMYTVQLHSIRQFTRYLYIQNTILLDGFSIRFLWLCRVRFESVLRRNWKQDGEGTLDGLDDKWALRRPKLIDPANTKKAFRLCV